MMVQRNASTAKVAAVPPSPTVIDFGPMAACAMLYPVSRARRMSRALVRCTMVRRIPLLFDADQLRRELFERLEERDHVVDLTEVEPEFGHRRMTGDDPFGERLLEILDRILAVERPERRRCRKRARAQLVDGVALRAVRPHEDEAALRGGQR